MKTLSKTHSKIIHQLHQLPSSTTNTFQIKGSGKSDVIKFLGTTSSAIKETVSSSQNYFTTFRIAEISTKHIPLTEYSPMQSNFLPKLISRDGLENILLEFEKKYKISSKEFYSKWEQGEVIDSFDSLKWASLYELWEKEDYLM